LVIAVLLTQSRLALGCLIGSVAVIIFGFNTKRAWLILLIIVGLGGGLLVVEPSLLGRHLSLVQQIFDGGTALPPRFYIWENLMSKMDGVWLFGHGMGVSLDNNVPRLPGETYETAHSVYIGQVYLTGIIGFILLLNFIFQAGRSALRQMESEKKGVTLSLVVFACLCMLGQYTLLLDHPKETWINILIPFSMAYGGSLWLDGDSKN
jgi:O-antigen ligase